MDSLKTILTVIWHFAPKESQPEQAPETENQFPTSSENEVSWSESDQPSEVDQLDQRLQKLMVQAKIISLLNNGKWKELHST